MSRKTKGTTLAAWRRTKLCIFYIQPNASGEVIDNLGGRCNKRHIVGIQCVKIWRVKMLSLATFCRKSQKRCFLATFDTSLYWICAKRLRECLFLNKNLSSRK